MIDLDKITTRFGRAYERNEKARTWLDKQRTRMFRAFTETLASQTLSRQTVIIPDGAESELFIQIHYPGWNLVYVNSNGTAVIEEDPALRKFTYVNRTNGQVYGRTVVNGSPSLDDERLQAENPELWERVSEWPEPWYSLVASTVTQFTHLPWHPDTLNIAVGRILTQNGVRRVLRDLNTLHTHDLADIQEYIIPGKLTAKLIPPRNAKPEELEG